MNTPEEQAVADATNIVEQEVDEIMELLKPLGNFGRR